MNAGDWLVYYSPTTNFPDGAFTALGRVVGDNAYAFDMGEGFVPYRRDVVYRKEVREVPVRTVAPELEFTSSRGNWGMLARRGHFEIGMADLHRIGIAMGARVDVFSMSAPRRLVGSTIRCELGERQSVFVRTASRTSCPKLSYSSSDAPARAPALPVHRARRTPGLSSPPLRPSTSR